MFKSIVLRSEFTKNVLTLMSGTVIAQAIPIAIAPILTRIYTPDDFGLFAVFFAILSIFSVVMNLRYENAVMLPKYEEEALSIFILGFLINTAISLILFIIVLFFNRPITELLGDERISFWLYFIPLTLFFVGLFNLLRLFNNRQKNYRDIAQAMVLKSVVMGVTQVAIGVLKAGVVGLISGQILSQFFANLRLFKNIYRREQFKKSFNLVKIIAMAKRYRQFPLFSLPSALINVLANHLTNLLISSLFSVVTLGFYSLVQRMLGIPSALIGQSIGQVFYEEGVRIKHQQGEISELFNHTLKKLIFVGFPLFFTLFWSVKPLFILIFGEDWAVAGEYAQIVIPMFFIRFVVTALSIVYDMFGALRVELLWQIVLLSGSILLIVLSSSFEVEFKDFLISLSIFISIMQLISLYILKKISSGEFK